MGRNWVGVAKAAAGLLLAGAVLWFLILPMIVSGLLFVAMGTLAVAALGFYVYLSHPAYTWRYLFPGILGMLVFVIFPLAYTIRLGFTNYSSKNLLTFERATQYLLDETVAGTGQRYEFTIHPAPGGVRLVFTAVAPENDQAAAAAAAAAEDQGDEEQGGKEAAVSTAAPAPPPARFATEAFEPDTVLQRSGTLEAAALAASASLTPPLELKEIIKLRPVLSQLKVRFPDGNLTTLASLHEFAPLEPAYAKGERGTLVNTQTHEVLTPNFKTGFYETPQGAGVRPGFKVGVGWANYVRVVTDSALTSPLLRIFLWTVAFAGLTVLFTLVVGMTLAVVLNWESLKLRTLYRTLLFLPYAVPGFISILVFRGLFNQNFGELNLILHGLFGIRPAWFSDPVLAKCMILIVNTWLGYPYIMVLCTGLIKAIPGDLYEASAMAGAGPLQNFWYVTVPLIMRPLTPLLISSFAFNFNNFVLISLLTDGRPDFIDARVPAGTTDILVSYTYRIAFQDSGQQFGLAAAISTVIFALVAGLSVINLRLTRGRVEGQGR
ncbi:MAG TPA: maltose ABC transporter permease MalF [Anaeromyxobacter sp.]|nr:maltose ABC transporter permease MalF [Anaeromyxobacter sp.]